MKVIVKIKNDSHWHEAFLLGGKWHIAANGEILPADHDLVESWSYMKPAEYTAAAKWNARFKAEAEELKNSVSASNDDTWYEKYKKLKQSGTSSAWVNDVEASPWFKGYQALSNMLQSSYEQSSSFHQNSADTNDSDSTGPRKGGGK
tara:strand:+ start:239 stop:679 length:441 start_codon:yes stop_codon:yes gene_type:complete